MHIRHRSKGALIVLLSSAALLTWIGVRIYDLLALGYVDSAIGTIRNIVSHETAFASAHPRQGYTCKLSELTNDQVLARLARDNARNGYTFQIDGCDPTAKPNRIFHATATLYAGEWQFFARMRAAY